ncbi:MAG: hypothetical protein K2X06_16965 [Burkholderiales bacterium]|nr:hypothetical protein [Burkholderiales bacterium]
MAAADDKSTNTAPGKNGAKRPVRISYAPDFASKAAYADGVHGVLLHGGVAHIDLYQVISPGNEKQNQPEQRVVSHRMVLPLAALGELGQIIGSMRQAAQKVAKQRATEPQK